MPPTRQSSTRIKKNNSIMAWIRLDTDFFTNDEICEMSIPGRYAVLGTLSYIKAHGGLGKVKATAQQIARSSEMSVNSVEEALKCSMFEVDGKIIQVVNWQYFQVDPTNASRQAEFRKRKKPPKKVTLSSLQPLRNDSNDYRTGQDRTGQDNTEGEEDHPAYSPKFAIPTVQEIEECGLLCGHIIDGQWYLDTYISQGWRKANGRPITDWRRHVASLKKYQNKFNPQDTPEQDPLELDRLIKQQEEFGKASRG